MFTGRDRGARGRWAVTLAAAMVAAVWLLPAGLWSPLVAAAAAAEPLPQTAPGDVPDQPPPRRESSGVWNQTYVGWTFNALGLGYSIVFLGLLFSLVGMFVVNLLTARRGNVAPLELVQVFESHLNDRKYRDAYDAARQDESVLGRVLAAGLGKVSEGYEQAVEAMQQVGEDENMKIEHRLSYMALIGTIAPMVGLFGTVHGMITSFTVIAFAKEQPAASDLAGGISTALFTTLLGLFIAIPAIASYNILRNRVRRLIHEVGILSEGLMNRFARPAAGS